MNSTRNEELAVNFLSDQLYTIPGVKPYINANDKQPSWDGEIHIYNNKNKDDSFKKEYFYRKIPLQLKSKIFSEKNKGNIKFSVDVVDLKNYLSDGGCIFFVVTLAEINNILEREIYYINLSMIKLRNILENPKNDSKRTISIELVPFPKEPIRRLKILMSVATDRDNQASFKDKELKTIDELLKEKKTPTFKIPQLSHPLLNRGYPLECNEASVYVQVPNSVCLEPVKDTITLIEKTITVHADVCINGKLFFDEYDVVFSDNRIIYKFGDCISLQKTELKKSYSDGYEIVFKSSNSLDTVLKNHEFVINLFEQKRLEVNDQVVEFFQEKTVNEKLNLSFERKRLEDFKKIRKTLTKLGYSGDLDFSKLNDSDRANLHSLVSSVLLNNSLKANYESGQMVTVIVGHLRFLMVVRLDPDKEGHIYLDDFSKKAFVAGTEDSTGHIIPTSIYCLITKDNLFDCVNVDYQIAIRSFKEAGDNEFNISQANYFALGLISFYDSCSEKNNKYLQYADNLLEWILSVCSEETMVYFFNRLQIKKRMGVTLTEDENDKLLQIIDETNCPITWKLAADTLLENYSAVRYRFKNRLSKTEKENYVQFPIFNLLPDTIRQACLAQVSSSNNSFSSDS